MTREYRIYQLDANNENVRRDHKMYESWDMLNRTAGFNIHQYIKVYEGIVEVDENSTDETALDTLFRIFNVCHPEDFHGHSMSVSDVVYLDGVKYYCDSFGWVKI